jgi:YhcH/YjgK/YiaL family protein
MVVDRLDESGRYFRLHPLFQQAFEFLERVAGDPERLADGRHTLVEGRLAVILERAEGRGLSGARLEAHRKMIDIQLVLGGEERIGWRPQPECLGVVEAYSAERDIEFYGEQPTTWLDLRRGDFAIFFPTDAHAPLAGSGPLRKAIAKVAVE